MPVRKHPLIELLFGLVEQLGFTVPVFTVLLGLGHASAQAFPLIDLLFALVYQVGHIVTSMPPQQPVGHASTQTVRVGTWHPASTPMLYLLAVLFGLRHASAQAAP